METKDKEAASKEASARIPTTGFRGGRFEGVGATMVGTDRGVHKPFHGMNRAQRRAMAASYAKEGAKAAPSPKGRVVDYPASLSTLAEHRITRDGDGLPRALSADEVLQELAAQGAAEGGEKAP